MKRLIYFLLAIVMLSSCADDFDSDMSDMPAEINPEGYYYSIDDPVLGLHLEIQTVGTFGEVVESPEWIQKAREEMYEKTPGQIHVYVVTYNGGRCILLLNMEANLISGRTNTRLYRLDGEEVSMANIGGEELSGQVRISPREMGK